jgi:hypothetical protein
MKTIVWDLDDVLNRFTQSWLHQAWRVEHPECRTPFAALRSNPPLRELNASREEYLESLDRFRLSPAGRDLKPHPQVLDWFRQSGDRFRHHVLTARPTRTAGAAAAWVFTHFGRWVRHFHFVPSPRSDESLPPYDTAKSEALARLGAVDIFIDDSPLNVAAASALDIHAFLFPQPWNASAQSVPEILLELTRHSPAEETADAPDCTRTLLPCWK